jgi:hypothetical protein
MALDTEKLNAFLGRFVNDLGATFHAGMVVIGEKLSLYKALAAGPLTSAELTAKTGTDERYVREWLSSQAAVCTPCSRSQEVGLCLGAQAGEARIRKVVTSGGFTRFRRAAQTPFNLVYEARP